MNLKKKLKKNNIFLWLSKGGMTNYLYLVQLPDDVVVEKHEPRKVLLRFYGEIVDLRQRFYECIIFTVLSERNIGPKTYGIFYSGRIEEYYPHRTVVNSELKNADVQRAIGKRLGEFHCVKLPLNREAQLVWENIEKFLGMVTTLHFDELEKQERLEHMLADFDFESEYIWMKDMLLKTNSPIVFCHNDVHEGNLIYMEEEEQGGGFDLRIIDFDYSGYNYRGFDIGNHFTEHIHEYGEQFEGGVIAKQENYPTREEQEIFAKSYLQSVQTMREKVLSGELDHGKYQCDFEPGTVEDILLEANRFALAANFYWIVWSIIQEKVSKISMNYLKHAEDRIVTYRRLKKEYCS